MFQSYALFPHLTWRRTSPSACNRKKVEKSEVGRRVKDALVLVDLPGFERRKPSQLSGGQHSGWPWPAPCQPPGCGCWNEPLGALDLKLRKQISSS